MPACSTPCPTESPLKPFGLASRVLAHARRTEDCDFKQITRNQLSNSPLAFKRRHSLDLERCFIRLLLMPSIFAARPDLRLHVGRGPQTKGNCLRRATEARRVPCFYVNVLGVEGSRQVSLCQWPQLKHAIRTRKSRPPGPVVRYAWENTGRTS